MILDLRYIPIIESNIEFSFRPSCLLNWAELSLELGRVVLVRNFIGPSGLVRVVSGPSCPAPVGGGGVEGGERGYKSPSPAA